MKKIYNAPGMKVVKLQPTNMIAASPLDHAGNAKTNGITSADSRGFNIFDGDDE